MGAPVKLSVRADGRFGPIAVDHDVGSEGHCEEACLFNAYKEYGRITDLE